MRFPYLLVLLISCKESKTQDSSIVEDSSEVEDSSIEDSSVDTSVPDQGWFTTGQDASVLLGAVDFNDAGGPLLFNHPKGIATDGTALLMADGNNNRVLVWRQKPEGNVAPDLVLGQTDFTGNNAGSGAAEMNWPVAVAAGGGKYVVADSYNHRLLVWNALPPNHGATPNLIIEGIRPEDEYPLSPRPDRFVWPWGVWTDGEKLVVSSTAAGSSTGGIGFGGWVLIWNSFPTSPDQPADIVLSASGDMGTPRSLVTDGETFLMVGDHNATDQPEKIGSWTWNEFPTENEQPVDAFLSPDNPWIWFSGTTTPMGKILLLADSLYLWDGIPDSGDPALRLQSDGWLRGGDGADVAVIGQNVYISDYNSYRIAVFDKFPINSSDMPDFTIGSPDIETDTFEENNFITNGSVATNGSNLIIGDGYDKRLNCWESIPAASGVDPTSVYQFNDGVVALAIHQERVVASGPNGGLRIWNSLPCDGSDPDRQESERIGSVQINSIASLALDQRYFYMVDSGVLYMWNGIPTGNDEPIKTMDLPYDEIMIHSDGVYLSVSSFKGFSIYPISDQGLGEEIQIADFGWSSVLGQGIVDGGHVFLADRGFNRVYAWKTVEGAIDGQLPDVLLGARDWDDTDPTVRQDGLFWPERLDFDGEVLWVGEYKFSGRVVGFRTE